MTRAASNLMTPKPTRLSPRPFPCTTLLVLFTCRKWVRCTALMELAYRLAVDESRYIGEIRDGMITLITPVVEVDGRDRMVDIYKWHLALDRKTSIRC